MAPPLQNKRRVLGKLFAGLVDSPLAATHEAREDQRLRFRPAFCEALLNQKLVGSALRTQRRKKLCPRGLRSNLAAQRGQGHRHDVTGVEPGLVVLRLR